jgi:hypothetical protein
MVSAWTPAEPGTPEEPVNELFAGIHRIIDAQIRMEQQWESLCRAYVERALQADRPAWAAAGRAIWAIGLSEHGDDDSALLQLVLAELDLQKELIEPRTDPDGGPTGPGAASNNLGVAYPIMRAYELGIPHFRLAVAESDARYGPRLWLQHLIDHLNITEALLRWALHCESVGRVAEARLMATEAHTRATQFIAMAAEHDRMDAIAVGEGLLLGARSVVSPDDITASDVKHGAVLCTGQVFGDESSEAIMWAVQARLCRVVGDVQGCLAAVAATRRSARPGDDSVVSAASREAALLANAEGPVWDYAQTLSTHAESARRRAVSAFRTRLTLAGLERKFEEVSAEPLATDAREMLRRQDQVRVDDATQGVAHVATEEWLAAIVSEDPRAQPLGHPEPHDHLLCGRGDLLEIVRGTGGDLVEDELLGGTAAEGHRHRLGELGPGGEELVLCR